MPIRVLCEGTHEVPVVLCDHCGKSIDSAGDGNYHWRMDVPGDFPGSPVYYTHKNCARTFERNNRGTWGAVPLECLPVFLAHNLQLDWNQAKHRADSVAGLSS